MNWFVQENKDAYTVSPDAAATGPRVGFLDAFETGYNLQVRTSAMYGIEKAMYEQDLEQTQAMRRAGIEDVPSLSEDAVKFFGSGAFSGTYLDTARFYENGGDPEIAQTLADYDRKVSELQKRYPELRLRTSRDMWDETKTKAQEYERRSSTARNTWGGTAGEIVGGMVGAFNPESDPWNLLTAPFGAAGRTILTRTLGQGAVQGVIETVNQITGVQEERKLLGLDSGFADALTRIGGAAAGGAALQGVGEALGWGARRFFRNAPADPVPTTPVPVRQPDPAEIAVARQVPEGVIPVDEAIGAAVLRERSLSYMDYLREVSPFGTSRIGKHHTTLELDYVTNRLNDWNAGEFPFNIGPKTDTFSTLSRSDYTAPTPTIFERVADTTAIDDMARRIDPATFRIYDKYAADSQSYRKWIEDNKAPRDALVENKLRQIDDAIYDLQEKQARSGAMKSKKYGQQIADLRQQREAAKAEMVKEDTLETAQIRRAIMRNDEKMRDLAPAVSRAYARARGKWDNTSEDRAAIKAMIREGRTNFVEPDAQATRVAEVLPRTLYDDAPILKQDYVIKEKMPKDADAADVATAILKANREAMETAMESFRAEVQNIAKMLDDADGKPLKPEPPAAGTTRVYYGAADNDWKPEAGAGLWTTPNIEYAKNYRRGKNENVVWYVDVPNDRLEALGVKNEVNGYLQNAKLPDEFVSQARRLDGKDVQLLGTDTRLSLDDKIVIPHEEGTGGREITLRELLREQRDIEEDLKAVQSCSIQ